MYQNISLFPFVEQTRKELEHLNKSLGKVTLTGKINALDVAYTLFEFMDDRIEKFDDIKDELVEALLEANLNKDVGQLKTKSQIAIDVLIRNLFERTADVGFLATDNIIIDFLDTEKSISADHMRTRLKEYAAKYTVYNEIVIFDTNGNVKVNMNTDNNVLSSQDPILKEALNSDSYVEVYKHSDIFSNQKRTLIYAQKIISRAKPIGVLCLCFKLDDELELIVNHLKTDEIEIAIADNTSIIKSSSASSNKVIAYNTNEYTIVSNKYLGVCSKTNGYQGFSGIEQWYSYAKYTSTPKAVITKFSEEEDNDKLPRYMRKKKRSILTNKLNAIIENADEIVDDLGDVIINGELIASKRRAYVLGPILDNLRDISTELLNSIRGSVSTLEKLVEDSLANDVKMASNLAIDIMDRNLYERANDSRWWALTPLFQEELAKEAPDTKALNSTLAYINDLYTVYTNLYIYNNKGKIVAASNDTSIIDQYIDTNILQNINNNSNTQNYFVSRFEDTDLYKKRPTYIYNASIRYDSKNVGGVGIVFDSEIEFKAMLEDSFPHNKTGFSFFIDKNKKIISSTHQSLKALDTLDIETELLNKAGKHSTHTYVDFEGEKYIVGIALSKGYREYKIEDNYTNDVYALTFVKI